MTSAQIIETPHGGFIQVEGLSDLVRFLKNSDTELQHAMQRGLKEAAAPVLRRARANASVIADDGTYRKSLSVVTKKGGSMLFLRSNDPAAGVKEFARKGAVYKPKPTDKRQNARKMNHWKVGVPRRANAPRVMIPAVDDSKEEVMTRIDACLAAILDKAV